MKESKIGSHSTESEKGSSGTAGEQTYPSSKQLGIRQINADVPEKPSTSVNSTESSDSSSDDHRSRGKDPEPKSNRPRTKLGTIGGKKAIESPGESIANVPPPKASVSSTPPRTKSKLGVIGGRKKHVPEQDSRPGSRIQDHDSEGTMVRDESQETSDVVWRTSKVVKEEKTAETEEGRAIRKRNELRAQLQKVPVLKKKRKF